MENIDEQENKARMLRGELYYAFTPKMAAERKRCKYACERFNKAGEVSRRRLVELWRDVNNDKTPLPPKAATEEEDEALFKDDPWVESPVTADYGSNVKIGVGVFINFNAIFLDTCQITIGDRILMGPNCCFYTASHPLDPFLRNGLQGPELGAPISIGDDCWLGGNVIVCPGVTIGKGCTIGAGSVVTKDVPDYHVAAGNPARLIRKIEVDEAKKKVLGTTRVTS